jgi:ribosome-associated protein
VNKTETRVELRWHPDGSGCLDEAQKMMVKSRLGNRITDQGILILVGEKFRSQHRNREEVTERFLNLVTASLVPDKKRHPTGPTRSSREKRIHEKRSRGEIKSIRRNRPEV